MRSRFAGPLSTSFVLSLASGCATESRMWRISPLSGEGGGSTSSSGERLNVSPFVYSDGSSTAVLWPLMDFDRRGFAVRPLLSKDGTEWDVLFPLSHFDTQSGEGWALTGYSCEDNVGLFPLCNFGPDFNFVGPVWWNESGGEVASGGLFPIVWIDAEEGDGLFLNAYSYDGNVGLFPLCNFGPSLDWLGPAWWRTDSGGVSDFGLLPLAYIDAEGGNGHLLNAYSLGENRGLFPLCNFGPDFNFVGPAWWSEQGDEITSCGLFPIAWIDAKARDGLILNAYSCDGNVGLFPLCNFGPEIDWLGPVWWERPEPDGSSSFGCFPLVWGEDGHDSSSLAVLPLWYQRLEPDHELRAALLPPTWWETDGDDEHHVVLPFYAHFADASESFTLVASFYAGSEDADGSSWFTPLANGWRAGDESGLNVYPLWWSSQSSESSSRVLLPFFLEQERGDERLLLTPLGGRGWDATGAATFTNVLGPLYHHSRGPDSETTALLWPLFEHERRGETTETRAFPLFDVTTTPSGHDAWLLGGLARHVSDGVSSSSRLWPLWSDRDATDSPDLLFDLTLAGHESHDGNWSSHLFPLFHASGDEQATRTYLLLGLGRLATTERGHAWRLWPLASSSTDPAAEGWLDPITLFRDERAEDTWSNRLFPLYSASGDDSRFTATALAGMARVATTESGHAWRLWPLASSSTDPAAEGWLDPITLFRHERADGDWSNRLFPLCSASGDDSSFTATALAGLARFSAIETGHAWRLWPLASSSTTAAADGWIDDLSLYRHEVRGASTSDRLFPLFAHERTYDSTETDLLLSLARHRSSESGNSWRLWPLVSTTASDADQRLLDCCTLLGVHPRADASRFQLASPLVFDLEVDRDDPSWKARLFCLLEFGREERAGFERHHAGFLFDWFLAESTVTASGEGATREESHYRLPLLHEYERTPERTEWDALLYAVHSVETQDEAKFSVLGYAYRSVRTGEATRRDIFPFITCDDAPDSRRVSFLWRLFAYERKGERVGGHLFFLPWGDAS